VVADILRTRTPISGVTNQHHPDSPDYAKRV
jgi:hypothetical protein